MAGTFKLLTDPWPDHAHGTIQVVADIGGGWSVFARVIPAKGFAIAEMRIQPIRRSKVQRGEWRWAYDEDPRAVSSVPDAGIPWRVMKGIREGDIKDAARSWLETIELAAGEWLQLEDGASKDDRSPKTVDGLLRAQMELRRMRGEDVREEAEQAKGLDTIERLAVLSSHYIALAGNGDPHPNASLAKDYERTPRQIASDIYRARHTYGLLTKTGVKKGVASRGSSLTKKAERILDRARVEGRWVPNTTEENEL